MTLMRILFFASSCGRTGAEIALHNIICNADRQKLKMAVVCKERGELLKEIPSDVPIFIDNSYRSIYKIYNKLYGGILNNTDNRLITAINSRFKPDVWYINTIIQPAVLQQARKNNIPCILHSHELEQMLVLLNEQDLRNMVEYPELVIAASRSVENVFRLLGRNNNIEVCYEPISLRKVESNPERSQAIRRSLKISEHTFIWAMSGTLDPNKNPVLFVDLASEMLKSNLDVHFMWLGKASSGYSVFAQEKARSLNLSEKIIWLGTRSDDYYDYLNVADGFILTSTRDSFPLVMMEAAALGKPIVSFNSGGVKEFVRAGMGTVIDSWNLSDLIRAMVEIMTGETYFDPRVTRELVKRFDVSVQVKHWENVISKYFMPTCNRLQPSSL